MESEGEEERKREREWLKKRKKERDTTSRPEKNENCSSVSFIQISFQHLETTDKISWMSMIAEWHIPTYRVYKLSYICCDWVTKSFILEFIENMTKLKSISLGLRTINGRTSYRWNFASWSIPFQNSSECLYVLYVLVHFISYCQHSYRQFSMWGK